MQFYIPDIIKYMPNICISYLNEIIIKDRRTKKYECVDFTQDRCDSVEKIQHTHIFLRSLFTCANRKMFATKYEFVKYW